MIFDKVYNKIIEKLGDNKAITLTYIRKFKKIPNIKAPKEFCEKLHVVKVSTWLEDKCDYVDKYKVRDYVEKRLGIKYLPQLYGVYKKSSEIDFNKLPDKFVLKLNNGCGCNLIVKNKNNINEEEVKKLADTWLQSNYYKISREKQYKNIEQVIVCEEYLEDDSGELRDYKLFCFNGEVKFIQVDTGRFSNHIQNFYDKKWNKLNFTFACEKNNYIDKKPKLLNEMIKKAEILSSDFPFVRIDFYYANERIYFGEITFTPKNGHRAFTPKEMDLEIASWIDMNKYKI